MNLFNKGKQILRARTTAKIEVPQPLETKADETEIPTVELTPEQEHLAKKFEIPTADNPTESARQQSMLDSQGLPNKAEYHPQGRTQEGNSNMWQRNYNNHQQN